MDPQDPDQTAPSRRPRRAPRRATAAAVLGSVAALGGAGSAVAQTTSGHRLSDTQRRPSRKADPLPAGERALLDQVFSSLSAQAPAIAKPILEVGVGEGTISRAQAERFLAGLRAADRPGPTGLPAAAPPSPAGHALFQRVFAAIRGELPVIALPLLLAALAEGAISEGQAARLRARFERGPQLGFGLVLRGARAAGATRLP